MRTLEEIEKDLAAAKAELAGAKGTPTEVYSRIVGYYRSVKNWNRGKREEFGERKLFRVPAVGAAVRKTTGAGNHVLLFVRASCPACPQAKDAASKLGIPVEYVDADAETGLEAAERLQVLSTPTAILFSADGRELGRARDAKAIAAFGAPAASAFAPAAPAALAAM